MKEFDSDRQDPTDLDYLIEEITVAAHCDDDILLRIHLSDFVPGHVRDHHLRQA